jgi:hypothetical protein
MLEPLLSLEGVAAWLDVEPEWLRRRILTMCNRIGFPRPLPVRGIRRWDPVALRHWADGYIAGAGARPIVPANDFVGDDGFEARVSRRLEAYFGTDLTTARER